MKAETYANLQGVSRFVKPFNVLQTWAFVWCEMPFKKSTKYQNELGQIEVNIIIW